MTVKKKNKVVNGLKKKGFRESNNDHQHLIFYVDDVMTSIRTKVSFGGNEIKEDNIHNMAYQCYLDKKGFLDLVDCTMTQEKYVALLKEQGILN